MCAARIPAVNRSIAFTQGCTWGKRTETDPIPQLNKKISAEVSSSQHAVMEDGGSNLAVTTRAATTRAATTPLGADVNLETSVGAPGVQSWMLLQANHPGVDKNIPCNTPLNKSVKKYLLKQSLGKQISWLC